MFNKFFLTLLLPLFVFCSLHGKETKAIEVKPVIVFDYGGVLATGDKEEFRSFVSERLSISIEEVRPFLRQVSKITKKTKDASLAWKEVAGARGVVLPDNWMELWEKSQLASYQERPHMMELVRALKRDGYTVAMLSNISQREAALIRKLGYYDPFDPLLLSYEIGVSKPKLQAFRILLSCLRVLSKQVIFIDDQEQNIVAARSLGIDGIQFYSYTQLVDALQKRNISFLKTP